MVKINDILQNDVNLHVYPAGYSAMTGWYHQHDGIINPIIEDLYGTDVDKILSDLLNVKKWEREFDLHQKDYFPKDL